MIAWLFIGALLAVFMRLFGFQFTALALLCIIIAELWKANAAAQASAKPSESSAAKTAAPPVPVAQLMAEARRSWKR
jgi:hypothetical protein